MPRWVKRSGSNIRGPCGTALAQLAQQATGMQPALVPVTIDDPEVLTYLSRRGAGGLPSLIIIMTSIISFIFAQRTAFRMRGLVMSSFDNFYMDDQHCLVYILAARKEYYR